MGYYSEAALVLDTESKKILTSMLDNLTLEDKRDEIALYFTEYAKVIEHKEETLYYWNMLKYYEDDKQNYPFPWFMKEFIYKLDTLSSEFRNQLNYEFLRVGENTEDITSLSSFNSKYFLLIQLSGIEVYKRYETKYDKLLEAIKVFIKACKTDYSNYIRNFINNFNK